MKGFLNPVANKPKKAADQAPKRTVVQPTNEKKQEPNEYTKKLDLAKSCLEEQRMAHRRQQQRIAREEEHLLSIDARKCPEPKRPERNKILASLQKESEELHSEIVQLSSQMNDLDEKEERLRRLARQGLDMFEQLDKMMEERNSLTRENEAMRRLMERMVTEEQINTLRLQNQEKQEARDNLKRYINLSNMEIDQTIFEIEKVISRRTGNILTIREEIEGLKVKREELLETHHTVKENLMKRF